jgi:undecaprenyl-diphosphatase
MDIVTAILLGIIEGLTEFLPISSTGHLILAGALLGIDESGASGTFKIVIQLGAILAVIVAYWRRFWDVAMGLLGGAAGPIAFTRNILLGFAPAMAIGVVVYEGVRALLQSPEVVAWALIVGGVVILALEKRLTQPRILSVEAMSWRTALAIGLLQCIAMIPGVSRSGATIMGALALGVERKTAAEFSFFVAVPTMIAAAAYTLLRDGAALAEGEWQLIAIGFAVAFIVALGVVKALVAIVGRYGFAPFAWYRIVVGSVALIWLYTR